jgi:hypothetical protein
MKNWLKAAWCFLRQHKVTAGGTCPVTGAVLLTCTKCGTDNMPKHNKGMSFN